MNNIVIPTIHQLRELFPAGVLTLSDQDTYDIRLFLNAYGMSVRNHIGFHKLVIDEAKIPDSLKSIESELVHPFLALGKEVGADTADDLYQRAGDIMKHMSHSDFIRFIDSWSDEMTMSRTLSNYSPLKGLPPIIAVEASRYAVTHIMLEQVWRAVNVAILRRYPFIRFNPTSFVRMRLSGTPVADAGKTNVLVIGYTQHEFGSELLYDCHGNRASAGDLNRRFNETFPELDTFSEDELSEI